MIPGPQNATNVATACRAIHGLDYYDDYTVVRTIKGAFVGWGGGCII